jgi:cytochrome c
MNPERSRHKRLMLAALLISLLTTACAEEVGTSEKVVEGGDPVAGEDAIELYGCGSCHAIHGVNGADGRVGPPLIDFEERHFIAGELPNEPENLVDWIVDPQSIEPGTAMPDLDISEQDARDIAAFLYSRENTPRRILWWEIQTITR